MQELPPGRSCAPHNHMRRTLALCLMELTDERSHDMGCFRVVVVIGSIEVGWHDRNEICPILLVVMLAHPYPCDLGHRICLVGDLEFAREQIFFFERHRCKPWIYA